jgi:hypothetical protein
MKLPWMFNKLPGTPDIADNAMPLTVIPSEPEIPDRLAEILACPKVTVVTKPVAETAAMAELVSPLLSWRVRWWVRSPSHLSSSSAMS